MMNMQCNFRGSNIVVQDTLFVNTYCPLVLMRVSPKIVQELDMAFKTLSSKIEQVTNTKRSI